MKVITQLVQHFWRRGVLTSSEADYLVRHGFVRERDLDGYSPPPPEELDEFPTRHDPEPLVALPLESVEETLARRKSARSRSGEPRGAVLEIDDLCRRVQRNFDLRKPHLPAVVGLGRRLSPCDDWPAALTVLRQADAADFNATLKAALRAKATLKDLWPALDVEPLHRLVKDREARGRAARAWLALLVAPDAGQLGKYAWILKSDAMQIVNNLRLVHSRLIAALVDIYEHDRRLLTRSLSNGSDPVATWALVLLHNARRRALSRASDDYGPLEEPDRVTWQQAWTAALRMDHSRVTLLLIACYHDRRARDRLRPEQSGHQLLCPKGWHIPRSKPLRAAGATT